MPSKVRLSVTVDQDALAVVDSYLATHPETDRSKLVSEALQLWVASEQRRALREQYEPLQERDEALLREERAAWNAVRDEANARTLGSAE